MGGALLSLSWSMGGSKAAVTMRLLHLCSWMTVILSSSPFGRVLGWAACADDFGPPGPERLFGQPAL